MISIKRHNNFTNWFQVYSFGKMLDEFNQRAKAVEYARSVALNKEQTHINIMGRATKVK
jgi:hypothetical protein